MITITLTGPAASGKTTLANAIEKLLSDHGIAVQGREKDNHIMLVNTNPTELSLLRVFTDQDREAS